MDEGTRKEETGKRKLADVDEEKDHTAEESACTASKRQKRRTDMNEQELCGAGGSARVPAKRQIRQAKTTKKSRPRATTDQAETRQEQRAGRRPYTRSTRQKLLVSLHPTKKGTVVYDNTGAAPQELEDKTFESCQAWLCIDSSMALSSYVHILEPVESWRNRIRTVNLPHSFSFRLLYLLLIHKEHRPKALHGYLPSNIPPNPQCYTPKPTAFQS